MARFINKFHTYINLSDFEKKYVTDFENDKRYNDIKKYLEDLFAHYTECSKIIYDEKIKDEQEIINNKEDEIFNLLPEEINQYINEIEVDRTLFNVYLENKVYSGGKVWSTKEFNILQKLSKDKQKLMILGRDEATFYSFLHLNMEDIANYIYSELFKLNNFKTPIQKKDDESYRIKSKITNLQAIGYLFTEMIEKGLIEPKKKNGKISPLNVSRMILDHFYFEDLEDQPGEEDLRKALFSDNKLSNDKISLFKLPTVKQLNH